MRRSAPSSSRPTPTTPTPCRPTSATRAAPRCSRWAPGSAGRPKWAATSSTRGSKSPSSPGKTKASLPLLLPSARRRAAGSGVNQTSLRPCQAVPWRPPGGPGRAAWRSGRRCRAGPGPRPDAGPVAVETGREQGRVVALQQSGEALGAVGGDQEHLLRLGDGTTVAVCRGGPVTGRRLGACSSTTCALMPPKPNALTAARRTGRSRRSPRASPSPADGTGWPRARGAGRRSAASAAAPRGGRRGPP